MRLATILTVLAMALALAAGEARAQAVSPPESLPVTAGEGRQTLEDILARQRGEGSVRPPRDSGTAADAAAGLAGQLGPLGGASDADLWDALRHGTAGISSSGHGPSAGTVIQDGGIWWQEVRRSVVAPWGGYLLLGMIGLLVLFFLARGRIRISHGPAGVTISRFSAIERFGHWLLAGSFILLGLTGLYSLFARRMLLSPGGAPNTEAAILERQGGATAETLLAYAKWVHNNVAWAFILGLVLVFVFWVAHNLPSRTDLVWFARGGGIVGKAHPPARKFNAGQKIIFWSVILLGGSIAASGLSLLFPFYLPLFAKTFGILNDIGLPGWFGYGPLPTDLAPQEEMQYAQLWHAIVSFVLMAIVIAHIYIGTLGMEGAWDAMGSGEVDLNWAREHHSLWVEEAEAKAAADPAARATPAE